MLGNIICLYNDIKELLQYVNGSVDQPAKNKISAILNAEEEFKSKQLSQIAIDHNYAKSLSVGDNNNINDPNSELHDLEVTERVNSKTLGDV